jgi:hypothetical protein
MSSQGRTLFDNSFSALVLVNARNGAERLHPARTPGHASRLTGGSSTAMNIRFAPEPEPTKNMIGLGEGQTMGPLPLGFEFEFFGVRYTWFDLSADGFMTFGTHPSRCFIPLSADLDNSIVLGWPDGCTLSRRQIAYEVRGGAPRRRLILSFTLGPQSPGNGLGTMTGQVVLHERTGMIDVHTTRQDPGVCRVSQEAVRFTTAPW